MINFQLEVILRLRGVLEPTCNRNHIVTSSQTTEQYGICKDNEKWLIKLSGSCIVICNKIFGHIVYMII